MCYSCAVLQDLFYVLLHVLFYLWWLLKHQSPNFTLDTHMCLKSGLHSPVGLNLTRNGWPPHEGQITYNSSCWKSSHQPCFVTNSAYFLSRTGDWGDLTWHQNTRDTALVNMKNLHKQGQHFGDSLIYAVRMTLSWNANADGASAVSAY